MSDLIRLGRPHCCACAGICHHIGPIQLCTAHAATPTPVRSVRIQEPDSPLNDRRMWPVLAEVAEERRRQDAKWGEQNHPDGTDGGAFYRERADWRRRACQDNAAAGTVTWRHILDEEVHEAYCETDPAKLRAELLQVAAVAVAWAAAIDRRGGAA